MMYQRGIDVRAVCRDGAGQVLLIPGADGRALLPGGSVAHGEHPADALARWAGGQVGAIVEVRRPVRVVTDIDQTTARGAWVHRDTIVYDALPAAGRVGPAGGWWVAVPALAETPLAPVTTRALGLAAEPTSTDGPHMVPWSAVPGSRARRRQRFAAYGHVTDPAGNVLLSLIADGYPGAGHWHLPGGGTDFGEAAEAGLAREIVEETGQQGEIGELLSVSHRHDISHRPRLRSLAWHRRDHRPLDWHGVRVIYAVRVPAPTTARVTERHGSTSEARWFPVAQARELPVTEVVQEALARA